MSDVAKARGTEFDIEMLSELLGAPVVPMVGHRSQGKGALLEAVAKRAAETQPRTAVIRYDRELENEIAKISELIDTNNSSLRRYRPRWLAIKLLESDKDVEEKVGSQKVLDNGDGNINYVYDIMREKYGDLTEFGVIVPTKVERTALQNAASVAGLLLTTDAVVSEIPEKTPPAPAGGGMEGMY